MKTETAPYTIVVDNREQRSYPFASALAIDPDADAIDAAARRLRTVRDLTAAAGDGATAAAVLAVYGGLARAARLAGDANGWTANEMELWLADRATVADAWLAAAWGDESSGPASDGPAAAPYTFTRPLASGRRLLTLRTAPGTLASGDYSLVGYETAIAIERKSLADAFSTFGGGRARFERELERLACLDFAAVVVEAELSQVMTAPPARSKMSPASVLGSVIAWQCRYPTVAWCFLPGREVAEGYVARLLDRWWREKNPVAVKVVNGEPQAPQAAEKTGKKVAAGDVYEGVWGVK